MTAEKRDSHFPRPQADLVRLLKKIYPMGYVNENSRNDLVNFNINGHRKPSMSILTMLQQDIIVESYYLEMSEM